MKRFHVHVAVQDLAASTQFYSTLFGAPPTVQKHDYAKWMLEDPRINFAISERDGAGGLNHLGFQADSDEELQGIHANLQKAGTEILAEQGANCCYAKSDEYWVKDPNSASHGVGSPVRLSSLGIRMGPAPALIGLENPQELRPVTEIVPALRPTFT